jgi:hypothetical protein
MHRFFLLLLIVSITTSVKSQIGNGPYLDEIYFMNRSGEKIKGTVSVDEKIVYMVIESKNAIGEKVVLTMDEGEDYFYKKQFLGAGSSFKILIKENTQKVKLTIYNAHKKKHVNRREKIEGYSKPEDAKH